MNVVSFRIVAFVALVAAADSRGTAPVEPLPPARPAADPDRVAAWGLAAVYLIFAYEWLVSGLDKLTAAGFPAGLAATLGDAAADDPHRWYARFLTGTVVPHVVAVARLVEGGELLVGLGLLAGAGRWLAGDRLPLAWRRPSRCSGRRCWPPTSP